MSARLAFGFLVLAGAGCDLVLGLPSPNEVKPVERVGEQLCGCPDLLSQGSEAVAACEAAVADASEQRLLELAEADCSDCANLSACYGLVTEAAAVGGPCVSQVECASFACCASADGTGGVCCDACLGCGALLDAGDWSSISDACAESSRVTALEACLCEAPESSVCLVACGESCDLGLAACRACLLGAASEACTVEIDACINDRNRPR